MADPGADVREYEAGSVSAGEVAEMLSPSLFGGQRVLVLRNGQDTRKDLAAALLAYAKNPDPEVTLIVAHPGGAKGKAFADGLTKAGATVIAAAKLKGDRERIAFVRDEFRRNGGRCDETAAAALLAAVGNDLREIAAACSQLMADTDGKISAAVVARYYKGRAEVSGFTVADAAMIGRPARRARGPTLGTARRRRPGPDRRRDRRRRPHRGPRRRRRPRQPVFAGQQPRHAGLENPARPGTQPRLDPRRPGRRDARGRRLQRGGERRGGGPRLRLGTGDLRGGGGKAIRPMTFSDRTPGEVHRLPMYARLLRLKHLAPSGFLCFAFLEGSLALGILLALAELVSWWGVLILPALVAVMV